MRDTVRYLLPAIPNVLYGGLGRHQAERLASLRKAGEIVWEQHARGKSFSVDFETLFQEALSPFDLVPAEFSVPRARDELIGQMADLLGISYNLLDLDILNIEDRQNALMRPPKEPPVISPNPPQADTSLAPPTQHGESDFPPPPPRMNPAAGSSVPVPATTPEAGLSAAPRPDTQADEDTHQHEPIVSPAAGTERLQAIRQLVDEHAGESLPDFAENALYAIPIQVDGLFPITDVWRIEPSLELPEALRTHIAQFAREIAEEAGLAECIAAVDSGIGFVCTLPSGALPDFGRGLLSLLREISQGSLLCSGESFRLSDAGLVKLFRLLRLARRLSDIETGADNAGY
jgi:hypothetical protein